MPDLTTRHDFEEFRDAPEALAYLLYVFLKIAICINYFCHLSCRPVTCKDIEFENVQRRSCESCNEKCFCPLLRWVGYNLWRIPTKLCHLLVGIFFGAPLGVVERSPTEYFEQKTDEQIDAERGDLRQEQETDEQIDAEKGDLRHEQETDEQIDAERGDPRHEQETDEQIDAERGNLRQDSSESESEDSSESESENEKIAGVPVFYIRGKKLKHREVNVLAIVAVPFIILIATTFWDRFWFNETYSCIDNSDHIYCFPQANSPYTNEDFNITRHDSKIDNCKKWNDSVRFICFEIVKNYGEALGDVGGLYTVFKVTTKVGATVIISVAGILCSTKQNGDNNSTRTNIKRCLRCIFQFGRASDNNYSLFTEHLPEYHCCSKRGEKSYSKIIRQLFAISLSMGEIVFALAIVIQYARHQPSLTHHDSLLFTVYKSLNIPLMIFGIVSTSLLLPLEKFTDKKNNKKYAYNCHKLCSKFKDACCKCCDCGQVAGCMKMFIYTLNCDCLTRRSHQREPYSNVGSGFPMKNRPPVVYQVQSSTGYGTF